MTDTERSEVADAKNDTEHLVDDLRDRLGDELSFHDGDVDVIVDHGSPGQLDTYVAPGTLELVGNLFIEPDQTISADLDSDRAARFRDRATTRLDKIWPHWQTFGFDRDGDPELTSASHRGRSPLLKQPVTYDADDLPDLAAALRWFTANQVQTV